MTFDREKLKQNVADLANQGVFIGTSSWKYPAWRGMLYDEQRYVYRGKLASRVLCHRSLQNQPLRRALFLSDFWMQAKAFRFP
jgi:hypothetical protein